MLSEQRNMCGLDDGSESRGRAANMRVGILGSGLMGGKLGTIFARAGHEVVFSDARSEEKLKRLARDAHVSARAGTPLFLSLRSRPEHKAWGVSPRKFRSSSKSPRERATGWRNKRLSPVCYGLRS